MKMYRVSNGEYFNRTEISAYAETEAKARKLHYKAMLKYAKAWDFDLDKRQKRAFKDDVWIEEFELGDVLADGEKI